MSHHYRLERCDESGQRLGEFRTLIGAGDADAVASADVVARQLGWRTWLLHEQATDKVIAFRDPGSSDDPWGDRWLFVLRH